jgi:hypothetical protein
MTEIPASCRNRHHAWPANPGPGSKCAGCGKEWGTRTARALGSERALAFAAALSPAVPAVQVPPSNPPTGEGALVAIVGPPVKPADPAEMTAAPTDTHRWLAKRTTTVFVGISEAIIGAAGRVANDPDPDDVRRFEAGLSKQLAVWFPNAPLGPKAEMAMAGCFILGEMWHGAKKKPTAEDAAPKSATNGTIAPPAGPGPSANANAIDEETLRALRTLDA